MLALLFIFVTTWLGIETTTRLSQEVTWFTYYLGGIFGLLISGLALEIWTKWRLREKSPARNRKERTFAICTIKDEIFR